jgi:hypothetical protein
MNWKYVFNTQLAFNAGSSFDDCCNYIKKIGYEFFTWNGEVYFISGDAVSKTKLTVEDLY